MGEAGNSTLNAPNPHRWESQTFKNQPTTLNVWSLKCPNALFQHFYSWRPPYRHHATSQHQELGSPSFAFNGKKLEVTQAPKHHSPFNIPWGVPMVQCWMRACKMSSISAHQHGEVPRIYFWVKNTNYRMIIMECILNIYVIFKGNIQTILYTFLKVHLGTCKNKKRSTSILFISSKGWQPSVWGMAN